MRRVRTAAWVMIKRVFDIVFGLILLILLGPVLAIVALIVRASSPGPIFYRGVRTGLHGRPFCIFKFRTMVHNAEALGGYSTAENDPRLTKSGRLLRKHKLDELPQLFNILRGEMSFVGPRPQVEHYTKLYTKQERIILSVRPGLTDYASIKYIDLDNILGDMDVDEKYRLEIEPDKNRLRMKYAKENNLLIDLKILLMTFLGMLKIKWNMRS